MSILGIPLLAALTVFAAPPAAGKSLSWVDASGEPSTLAQGTLDLTRISLTFDGTDLVTTSRFASLGEPPPTGTGQHLQLEFGTQGRDYSVVLVRDREAGDRMEVFVTADPDRNGVREFLRKPCSACDFSLDFARSEVTVRFSPRILAAFGKPAPRTLTDLVAKTGPTYAISRENVLLYANSVGDTAPAPEGTQFSF